MLKLPKMFIFAILFSIVLRTSVLAETLKDRDNGYLMLVNTEYTVSADFSPERIRFADTYYYLREEAAKELEEMLDDMEKELGKAPMVVSTYRTYEKQVDLFNSDYEEKIAEGIEPDEAMRQTRRYVALPGASEHHTALAADLSNDGTLEEDFITTEAGKWIKDNCYKYGFVVRYPDNKEKITGIGYEPWHIRYVGRPHSDIIYENGWCLEEYIEYLENNGIISWSDGINIWNIYYIEDENAEFPNMTAVSSSNTGGYIVTTYKGTMLIKKAVNYRISSDMKKRLVEKLNLAAE